MSGPAPRPHVFPKKRFQAAVVAAIDQHAGAIHQISEKQQAQGEFLADLAVARDAHAKRLVDDGALIYNFRYRSTLLQRLRWLLTGK